MANRDEDVKTTVAVATFIAIILLVGLSWYDDATADCASYKNTTVRFMPARCLAYWSGQGKAEK